MTTAVLITGASSGIGRATAQRLARREDLTAYATARRPAALAELAGQGIRTLALDVTDEASMAAAAHTVEERHGSVGALVNNAGYGQYGTIEETTRPVPPLFAGKGPPNPGGTADRVRRPP